VVDLLLNTHLCGQCRRKVVDGCGDFRLNGCVDLVLDAVLRRYLPREVSERSSVGGDPLVALVDMTVCYREIDFVFVLKLAQIGGLSFEFKFLLGHTMAQTVGAVFLMLDGVMDRLDVSADLDFEQSLVITFEVGHQDILLLGKFSEEGLDHARWALVIAILGVLRWVAVLHMLQV
jgi:hypothetical protein